MDMILSCPLCQTRYLIPASLFANGPRQVRCVRCMHSWLAELPKEIDVVAPPAPEPMPIPEVVTAIPPGSNLPVLHKVLTPRMRRAIQIGVGVTIFLLIATGLFARNSIAARWPAMENLYDAIGLRIYHYGEGLSFTNVHSELRYDSGLTELVVEGKVHNETKNVQELPNILATAVTSDGGSIQSWQIDAPAIRVLPGEDVPFHSAITAPKGSVTEVNLSFIEINHDPD